MIRLSLSPTTEQINIPRLPTIWPKSPCSGSPSPTRRVLASPYTHSTEVSAQQAKASGKASDKMVLLDIISMIFRLAELVFAAIVAGVNGKYLHDVRGTSTWDQSRFIYTEVVAGLAILLSLLWLLPFASSFVHWGAEIIISICWFVAFGLIVNVSRLVKSNQACRKTDIGTPRSSTAAAATSSTGET